MKSSSLPYLIKEGAYGIVRRVFMSFASVFVIVACLLIMGTFTLLAANVQSILNTLENDNRIVAYVDDSLTEEQARALESAIEAQDNVQDAQFVPNTQALEEFKQEYEDSSLLDDLDADVLRHRYIISLKNVSGMESAIEGIRTVTGVAEVSGHLEIARGFSAMRNVIGLVAAALTAVLFGISLLIMTNTIRLTTYDRREEIAIMRMVGATNGFIRLPFIVEGLYLGLFGALAAFLLQWGLYGFISTRIDEAGLGFLRVIPYTQIAIPLLAAFLAVGLIVGVAGSLTAIRQYLKV